MHLPEALEQFRQRTGVLPTSVRVGRRVFAIVLGDHRGEPHPDRAWVLSMVWPWEICVQLDTALSDDDVIAQ
jgi:hypothetical protein